jgi:PAS domain S-box-containing protein
MMSAESRLRLAFVLGALVILALVAVALRNAQHYAQSRAWVEHTQEVERELADMRYDLTRTQAQVRGYLLFGRQEYLDRANEARRSLYGHFDRIAKLTADNPPQQARLARVRAGVGETLAIEDDEIEKKKPAAVAPETPPETVLLLGIRNDLQAMVDEERSLLEERHDAELRASQYSGFASALVVLGLCAASFVFYRRVRNDMAARRRAAVELRRTNLFLDTMIESLPLMIFVKEAEHLTFTRMNRAGEELLGMSRTALLGKGDKDFFPEEQAKFFQEKDRATLRSQAMVDIPEEPLQTAKGIRWLHTKKVPLLEKDGTPLFLLGISEDITEAKRAQEELRAAKERAEATSRELEAFSYSVSHDLRTPLRGIDGFSAALLEDYANKLDDTGKDYLNRVRAAAQRMGQLIDDLLELSRVSRQELKREDVDVSAIARAVAEELKRSAAGRSVEVQVADGLHAAGDPRLIRVALENLFGNAFKFTSKVPAASISFGREGEVFFVRDNGAGFDMQFADKLFGAFQRLHAKHEFEGTGIGLATVQRIIARHGGKIWATSAPGQGATFRFTLR